MASTGIENHISVWLPRRGSEVNGTAGFCKMHKSVSEMKLKVMSPAIRQMRQELELLRDSIEKPLSLINFAV